MAVWPACVSRRPTAQLRCRRLPVAPSMLISTLTVRRCLLLGLMLACLIALADGVARHELQKAAGEMAFAVTGAQVADASDE